MDFGEALGVAPFENRRWDPPLLPESQDPRPQDLAVLLAAVLWVAVLVGTGFVLDWALEEDHNGIWPTLVISVQVLGFGPSVLLSVMLLNVESRRPARLHVQEHHSCLLYTSPSPRDQRGSRMPSSA